MGLRIGIDWSGTPATLAQSTQGPWLVVAASCVSDEDHPAVIEYLAAMRRQYRLNDRFVFHYSACRESIRRGLLDGVDALPVMTYVSVIDKREWDGTYLHTHRSGLEREVDAVASLLSACPGAPAQRATVLIDAPPSEARLISAIRKRLSIDARAMRVDPPIRVRAIPDTHRDGDLVQLADMVAGEVRTRLERGLSTDFAARVAIV